MPTRAGARRLYEPYKLGASRVARIMGGLLMFAGMIAGLVASMLVTALVMDGGKLDESQGSCRWF